MNLGNCDIIYNSGVNSIYGYVFSTNIETNITSFFYPALSTIISVCHTTTKLWIYNNINIVEYNITLTPFLATYNRTITLSESIGGQLTSIDNNTLISSNYDNTYIIEIGISGSSGVITNKFPINPGERTVTTNFLYVSTPTPKLIYGTYKYLDGYYYITQLDYATGNVEFEKAQAINNITGLFTDSNELYFISTEFTPAIYLIDRNIPYVTTDFSGFVKYPPSPFSNPSQPPECGNTSITPQPQPPTCDTNLVYTNCISYVKAIFLTGGDVEYVTCQGDTITADINTLPVSGNISIISNTDCIDITTLTYSSDYPNYWGITEYGPCCPPVIPPIPVITGYKNECGVITISPMIVECVVSNPTSFDSTDGEVSLSITGGTAPYTVTWRYKGNAIISPNLNGLGNGSYTATTVDYWGDYSSTTVCKILTDKVCTFSASIEEFIPPSPTPTPTVTPTQTPTPSVTPPPLPPTIEYFQDCCNSLTVYKVGGVSTPITVGNNYYITTNGFSGCVTALSGPPYNSQSLIITVSPYDSCVLCEDVNPCLSPTPTPTPTRTLTPTPTKTLTPTPTKTPTPTPTKTRLPAPCTTRPNGLTNYTLAVEYKRTGEPANRFGIGGTYTTACNAWFDFNIAISNPGGNFAWGYYEGQSQWTVGSVVYYDFDRTDCSTVQAGSYWLQTRSDFAAGWFIYPSVNPALPNIEIVTINSLGVITAITNCNYQP